MNLTKCKNIYVILVFVFLSINLYAQNKLTVPDRALVDREKLAQCKREIETIRAMQLKCDTLYMEGDWFTGLYFDKQGQLRKNMWKWAFHDGTHEYVTLSSYYNAIGELIFAEQESGSNCTDEEEYFYLHNGRIVDCGYYYDCGCCEESDQEWVESRHPVIGSLLVELKNEGWWEWFISARNTLNFYYEHYQYDDAKVMPGVIIPEDGRPYFRQVESLKSLAPHKILDSIDNPKAYLLEYGTYPYNSKVIAIKKENQYAEIKFLSDGVPYEEYEMSRQNIDDVGNDELVIRWKNSNEENGIFVWNLDTYNCILNIQETKYKGLTHDNPEGSGYNVNLGKKRLTVQIVKNREKNILGLKYIYKYMESGFVLDKVE